MELICRENAENEDIITFECYDEKKSKQQYLGYTSMKIGILPTNYCSLD
jgi:hypothetical protein